MELGLYALDSLQMWMLMVAALSAISPTPVRLGVTVRVDVPAAVPERLIVSSLVAALAVTPLGSPVKL